MQLCLSICRGSHQYYALDAPLVCSVKGGLEEVQRRRSIQHKHRVEAVLGAVLGPEGVRVVLFSWGPPAKELLLLSKPLLNWFFRAQLRVASLRCQKTATTELNWFFASLRSRIINAG